jgi:hypothetical protein
MEVQPKETHPTPEKGITRPMTSALAVSMAFMRLIPYALRIPAALNFAPSVATEVFAGARLRSWHAFAIPLGMRVLIDLVLIPIQGVGSSMSLYITAMAWVYPAIILNVLIGRLVSRTESAIRIGGATILGSVLFYLITNFGSWLAMSGAELPIYERSFSGLLTCYVAGIVFADSDKSPIFGFFGNSLIGNLGFAAIFFTAHAWLSRTAFPRERVPAVAIAQ